MKCCDNQVLKTVDGCQICENCDTLVDDLIFENNIIVNQTVKNYRIKKFQELVYAARVPWYVRETLLEYFPVVENFFEETARTNFFNMGQIARELCVVTGYGEYCDCFSKLKTLARAKVVKNFIENCVKNNAVTARFDKLEQLAMIESKVDFIEEPKNAGDHIFSAK